ncbi:MAG: YabP/YqfC family sporulation protein [Clostridia bacterium]|nr:YabP/YqfC family sporulation protein [Clostridia bacterium]
MIGLWQDITDDMGRYRILLLGSKAVRIEGVTDLVDFGSEEISVRVGKERLRLKGSGLCIKEIAKGELEVEGKICSVELE